MRTLRWSMALDLIFLLHADHEQNCSTSTVRMVGSSEANLFASVAAGCLRPVGAAARRGECGGGEHAWRKSATKNISVGDYVAQGKDKKAGIRLMGFGHRVYKNFDPRAKIIKKSCEKVLAKLHINDPLLDMAKELEAVALGDEYFIQAQALSQRGFLQRRHSSRARHSQGDVHCDLRHRPDAGLDRALVRGEQGHQNQPSTPDLHRLGAAGLSAARRAALNAGQR